MIPPIVYDGGMTQTAPTSRPAGEQMLSEQVYAHLRDAIMRGDYAPVTPSSPRTSPSNKA